MKPDNRPEISMTDVLANAKPLVVLVPSTDSSHEIAKRAAVHMPNVTGQNDITQKANELKKAKTGGMAKAVLEASEAAGRLMLPKDIKVVVSCLEEGGQTCFVFPDGSSLECLGLNFDRIYWGEVGGETYDLKSF